MFPSSAIHVVEHTPAKLVILDPPFYAFALILLFLGVGNVVAYGLKAAVTGKNVLNVSLIALLFVSPILLIGAGLLGSRTLVTFSRSLGRVTIERRLVGLPLPKKEIPLAEVRNAEIQVALRQTKSLALVLRNGSKVSLSTAFTNIGGQYESAAAINKFLKEN